MADKTVTFDETVPADAGGTVPAAFDAKGLVDALVAANTANALDLPEDKLIAAPLGFEAMEDAADKIAERLGATINGAGNRILVTANADLAASGAAFVEVDTMLDALLKLTASPPARQRARGLAVAAATGLAGALPGIMSLLTPKLTVRMSPVAANDLAAAAAVMNALGNGKDGSATFHHDRFRIPRGGRLGEKLTTLMTQRLELSRQRIALPADAPAATAAEIDAKLKAIDDFTAAIRAPAEGGTQSILASALLASPLQEARFTHVLLVKSEAGQSQQTIDDRPFFAADRVSVLTELAITVMLLRADNNQIVASATVSGKAHGFGKVGEEMTISRPRRR